MSDLREAMIRRFEGQREQVVFDLRRAADKVEREEVREDLLTLKPDYPAAASRITRTVTWMLANLRLEELHTAAALADRELQKEDNNDA